MTRVLNSVKQLALPALFLAFSTASIASVEVGRLEINFSTFLDKRMDRISAIDKRREEAFHKYRRDGARISQLPRDLLNNGRFPQTQWANERLIPDLEQYSIPSLIAEMMKRGIEGANPDGFDGRVVLDVDKMHVARFPLAAIGSFNTRMEGKVKIYDSEGNLVTEKKVRTTLVPKFKASRNYRGSDYAYLSTAGTSRIGPIAAEFTAEALEKAFPGYEAPDLVFLLPSEVGG
jgi:hypothetical protein